MTVIITKTVSKRADELRPGDLVLSPMGLRVRDAYPVMGGIRVNWSHDLYGYRGTNWRIYPADYGFSVYPI